ncbi:hypothetical protein NVV93_05730 [Pseudomonas sp. LS44]|uniref:hypothetical protein n=1 Tax=Pseudomonas sp. LS44 TaxID=1357074 RepID=UPI00215A3B86|nr:hypothetical protein [Pseudomonas sp. LS44]UVE18891.1 hypothetical protein NVV93_05730 [Pseudomonas sp. LS44]
MCFLIFSARQGRKKRAESSSFAKQRIAPNLAYPVKKKTESRAFGHFLHKQSGLPMNGWQPGFLAMLR